MSMGTSGRGNNSEVVRVWLLGGFRVSVGSRTIGEDRWRRRKAAALVKLLALAPGHRMHRERVMDLLWPRLGERLQPTTCTATFTSPAALLSPTSTPPPVT